MNFQLVFVLECVMDLFHAIGRADEAAIVEILAKKPRIFETIRDESILRYAIKNCPEEKLTKTMSVLINHGASVNDNCGDNMSPLNTAALWLKKPKNIVKLLITEGADVNYQDDQVTRRKHFL